MAPDDRARRSALRAALRERRAALAPELVTAASARITAHVLAAPWWQAADSIALFVGVRNEPDTDALLVAAMRSNKDVWLPRVDSLGLDFVRLHALADLRPSCFGLREPVIGDAHVPTRLERIAPPLVLVPGLAFGTGGARIGFGRGYYDQALAPLRDRPDCLRVGLAFAGFVDPPEGEIPMADHDVPVHLVVTEHGIVEAR